MGTTPAGPGGEDNAGNGRARGRSGGVASNVVTAIAVFVGFGVAGFLLVMCFLARRG
jgi:hypothetical protein